MKRLKLPGMLDGGLCPVVWLADVEYGSQRSRRGNSHQRWLDLTRSADRNASPATRWPDSGVRRNGIGLALGARS